MPSLFEFDLPAAVDLRDSSFPRDSSLSDTVSSQVAGQGGILDCLATNFLVPYPSEPPYYFTILPTTGPMDDLFRVIQTICLKSAVWSKLTTGAYSLSGEGVDFDNQAGLGRSQGPTVGRMNLLAT